MKIAFAPNNAKQFKNAALITLLLVVTVTLFLSKGFIVNNLGLKRYAIELFETGEFAKSIPELEKVVSNQPRDHESRAMLALSYMFTGKIKEAEVQYESIMNDSPESPEVLYKLGLAYHNQGKHDKSADLLKKAADKGTANSIIREQLVDCYTNIKNYEEARKQLSLLMKDENMSTDKKAFAMERIGDLYSEEGNKHKAKEAYIKALTYADYYRIREKRDAF